MSSGSGSGGGGNRSRSDELPHEDNSHGSTIQDADALVTRMQEWNRLWYSFRSGEDQHQEGSIIQDSAAIARMREWNRLWHSHGFGDEERIAALFNCLSHNDEYMTWIPGIFTGRLEGRGVPLANALQHNTRLERIEIPLTIVYNSGHLIDHIQIEGLLAYVRQSKSLRSFCLHAFGDRDDLLQTGTLWMQAVAQNKHIEELDVNSSGRFRLSSDALLHITRMSLKRLRIPLCLDDDHKVFFNTAQSIPTLQKLEVSTKTTRPQETADLIQKLPCPPNIVELALEVRHYPDRNPSFPITEALATFVSKAPSSLTEFSLIRGRFDKENMECFLEGLLANRFIVKLTLKWSICSDDAAAAFLVYMTEKNGVCNTGIKSLVLLNITAFCTVVVPLIKGPRGSGLLSLELNQYSTRPLLRDFETYQRCESRNLQCLKIVVDREEYYDHLVRHLPNLVYLLKIELEFFEFQTNSTGVLDAIRKNGCLCSVLAYQCSYLNSKHLSLWSPKEARLAEAFGQRNRHLPVVLKNLGAANTSDRGDVNAESEAAMSSQNTNCAAPLAPPLFLVAQHTPRMALHHVFCGITTLKTSIGSPRRSSIRVRSQP